MMIAVVPQVEGLYRDLGKTIAGVDAGFSGDLNSS